jgi:hypothetical protein
MSDYIPDSDGDFLRWAKAFVDYLVTNVTSLGILKIQSEAVQDMVNDFEKALMACNAKTAAKNTMETKNFSRFTTEEVIRLLVHQIQANPNITDAYRAAIGIIASNCRKPATEEIAPTSKPVGTIDTSQRLQHSISFTDENTPTNPACPTGVICCEIWATVKADDDMIPTEPSDFSFLAIDTETPYCINYSNSDAGKTAYYILRWVKNNTMKGPWSKAISAIITE